MKNKILLIMLVLPLVILAACQPLASEQNLVTGRATTTSSGEEKTVTSPPINIEVKDSDEEPEEIELPSLMGWGAETQGAWGHPDGIEPKILIVDRLTNDPSDGDPETGKGSFFWALSQEYPRVIVFEVGGIIDMNWTRYGSTHGRNRNGQFDINNPYVTVAGHTAPSPGITLIKGGLWIWTHDVIIQHIAIRPGAHPSLMDTITEDNPDGHNFTNLMSAIAVRGGQFDIIVDHCSFTWGTRYHINAFEDHDIWATGRITFSNNIIGETVRGGRGDGGTGGFFIGHDLALVKNLWAWNFHRNPHLSSSQGVYANNFIRGMSISTTYGRPSVTFEGNYGVWGNHPSPLSGRRLYWLNSDSMPRVYFEDNELYRSDWETPITPIWTISHGEEPGVREIIHLEEREQWHDTIELVLAEDLLDYLDINVGARPWDRDAIDQGIIDKVRYGTGKIQFAYVEEWEPDKVYSMRNAVNYEVNGTLYTFHALQHQFSGVPPTNTEYWQQLWPASENWDESWYPDHEPTYREFNPDEWDLDAEGVEPKKWPI